MSGKIKSKDLSYNSALPSFLQRLHEQKAGRGDGDRHEREIARPRRAKDANDDDGPTVVDASGETLSKDEVKELTGDAEDEGTKTDTTGNTVEDIDKLLPETDRAPEIKRAEQKLSDGLAQKKRKAVKIVGDDDNDDQLSGELATKPKKSKKKAKPIKLAFDADEGS